MLRKIFGPKRDEVTRGWRKLHNGKLSDLYCSPNSNRVFKSRRIKWAVHVARIGERRDAYKFFLWGNVRERAHLGGQGVDRRTILRRIFRTWNVGAWTGLIWLSTGTVGGNL